MTAFTSKADPEALTLTFVAEFEAPVDRIWRVWEDPRQLERWWGPPGYPATFEQHELAPGGRSVYYLSSPDGERMWFEWRTVSVEPPHRIELEDGGTPDGAEPGPEGPARITVTLAEEGGRTRMTMVNTFGSTEDLERTLAMGMEDVIPLVLGQIDALLAED